MSDQRSTQDETLAPDDAALIDAVRARFEEHWRTGQLLRIEDCLGEVGAGARQRLLRELVTLELELRQRQGNTVAVDDYVARFPELDRQWLLAVACPLGTASPRQENNPTEGSFQGTRARRIRCPHCHNPIQLVDERSDDVLCPGCGSSFTVRDARHTDTTSRSRPLGKYQLLERVGLGAFGAVWKARDTELDRNVALKIPHTGLLTNVTDLQRFHREARAAAQLRHPGIVPVHNVETLEGLPTIVSDFIEGVPLRDLLQTRRLTFREATCLLADVAEAVHYAHSLGVVHRDLKPANILISFDRAFRGTTPTAEPALGPDDRRSELRPHVTDFGLALRDECEVTMTIDGHIIGTPAYMSPEQAAGKGHKADARSDVYSLGVIFYELLTGELPFRGSKLMMLEQVRYEEPRAPRKLNDQIPRDLDTVCMKTLEKNPARRYATARELSEELRRWLTGEPVHARRVGIWERLYKWTRRYPSRAALVALSLVAVAVFVVGVLLHNTRLEELLVKEKQQRERADEQIVKLHVMNGVDLAAQCNVLGSFPWFIEALKREQGEPEKEAAHRARVAAYLGQYPRLRRMWFHSPMLTCANFSPDGRRVVSTCAGGTVRIWNVESGGFVTLPINHVGPVRHAAFSPDGRCIVTAGDDRWVRRWNTITGDELEARLEHPKGVQAVSFAPDGNMIATACLDGKARLWNLDTGKQVANPFEHDMPVLHVAFSPDGQRLVTACANGTASVWDISTGNPVYSQYHFGGAVQATFSPDGDRVLSAGRDGTAIVWETDDRFGRLPLTFRHMNQVLHTAFSPDARRILTVSDDQTVRIWDARTGEQCSLPLWHGSQVRHAAFSPNGRHVVTGSDDGLVRIWDWVPSAMLPVSHQARIYDAVFHPTGRQILAGGDEGKTWFWDALTANDRHLSQKASYTVRKVAVSRDGRRAAAGDSTFGVWDMASGHVLRSPCLPVNNWREGNQSKSDAFTPPLKTTLPNAIRRLSFSPDGEWLIATRGSEVYLLAAKGDDQPIALGGPAPKEPAKAMPSGQPPAPVPPPKTTGSNIVTLTNWKDPLDTGLFLGTITFLEPISGRLPPEQQPQQPGMTPPTPGMQTPGMQTPGMQTPGMQTPGMQTPGMQTPGMQTPGMQTPGMGPPGPGGQAPRDAAAQASPGAISVAGGASQPRSAADVRALLEPCAHAFFTSDSKHVVTARNHQVEIWDVSTPVRHEICAFPSARDCTVMLAGGRRWRRSQGSARET